MTTPKKVEVTKPVDDVEARAMFAGDAAGPVSLGQYWQQYTNKLRAGDVGSLPAILGLVVLLIVFTIAAPGTFLSTFNLANLLTQAGSICVLAMGIGFVLLLGHIDLSAGVIGGVGAGVMAEMLLKGLPWYLTILIALLVGVVMGVFTGVLVSAVGIPSFVVTLATFLAYQGVLLWIIGTGGTVPINNEVIVAVSNGNMPVTLGWIVVIASIAAYAGINLVVYQRRRSANLVTPPLQVIVLRIVVIAVLLLGATFLLSQNRSKGTIPLEGIPWIAPIVGVLLVFWTFIQNRTAFGRHVYAVGGNAEAARRAGIRVGQITIACFVISSAMAVISGIIAASRLNSVTPDAGAGNTLLYAVAAAVIGGTSLFGGKGKARDAIIGGLVIAVIDNGLGLLGLQAYIKYIVTGLVLLLAASVDAISRRRRASAGR
ncbi:sugar ABC transporter permease [Nakamurella multipartita]|jgi:D-xylose transport system permease protein|uniref:Xylose transport system permease protein XylH n=1 Tax=Nakamurella multipartita (strain ATCC 700099 / DSM 44233 / CIP 104796 / JCM 9543 / NBRC 105858 / Y-104) TaxID=479431 RepID=C8XDC0_NAKMY|nr:ABC transporter permease [Nakamurella multipartita]ACV81610.1 inner-membrane translocator [Nakamurella multipartita DSM 44233]HOZ57934.1 ABC transporter permease [Nakamurella multipartita]